MIHVVRFKTDLFDVSKEPENPINPIGGVSLLEWLQSEIQSRFALDMTDIGSEDWGWYFYAELDGRDYMLGASTDPEDKDREWVLQIDKHRTFMEKLLGKAKMTADDPMVAKVMALVAAEPGFRNVTVD